MTPRLLSIFCLCQLGSVGFSWLIARIIRKGFERGGMLDQLPTLLGAFASYGWLLILIPILCVLMIPRHRDEEESPSWRWPATVAGSLGLVAFGGPLVFLVFALSHTATA
jgi:hypothetical protein